MKDIGRAGVVLLGIFWETESRIPPKNESFRVSQTWAGILARILTFVSLGFLICKMSYFEDFSSQLFEDLQRYRKVERIVY